MRPFQHLPMPAPAEHDPGPVFFYENFVKPFIPDMLKMMDAGLPIDDNAVDELRTVIDEVLESVTKRLAESPIIQRYQRHRLPAAQKAYFEKCTQSVRTLEDYIKPFNDKDVLHRTWVVNTFLRTLRKDKDIQDRWTLKDLKKYNIWLRDPFIAALCKKRSLTQNTHVLAGMKALAEYKLDLWNRPRYEKAEEPVPVELFNPGSSKQCRELFDMLGIEPLATSKDTGGASWGRDQVEQLLQVTTDPELKDVLITLIDFSYSGIIKTNFLKAFDSYTIDGLLHGNIKLFGAKSFRNTSNSPNLLNAPSSRSIYAKALKRCFTASEGRVVYTADLSALEDRVIANLSKDTNKINIFDKKMDGHSLNACGYFPHQISKIMGKPKRENDPEYIKEFYRLSQTDPVLDKIRFTSKAPTFKLAYGGYPDAHKGGVITQEIFDNYHNILYPGITKYREEYILPTVKQQGYIHLGLGCRMYSSDAETNIRTLNNGTVQFWSILTLIAINEFNHRIREEHLEYDVEVNSTIYDSIYTNVVRDADVIKWVNDNLIELMCVQYLEDEPIHNEAEGEIGLNWADLHKVPNNASVNEITDILESL